MERARPSYARATPALKPADWLPRFGYGTGAMLRATADHPNAATHTLCAPAKIPSPERAYPKFLPSRGVTSGPGVPTGGSLPGATTSNEFKTPQTTIRSGCIRHAAKAISGVSIPGTPAQIPGDFWPAVIFLQRRKSGDAEGIWGMNCLLAATRSGARTRRAGIDVASGASRFRAP